MSQLQVTRSSVSEDLEDDFVSPYFPWPRVERTRSAIYGSVDEAAQLRVRYALRTVVEARPFRPLAVVDRFLAGSIVLRLDDENFTSELQQLLSGAVRNLFGFTTSEDDLGAPRVDVLLGAVEDLTAWMGITKQALSKYVGISYSTVLAWRRERPARPRHKDIPTLLALWSALSGAQEEFGVEGALQMVWAAGATRDGVPATPAAVLADWIVEQTSEANMADFLADDGYVAGTAAAPDVEALAAAEGQLHAALEESQAGSGPSAGR